MLFMDDKLLILLIHNFITYTYAQKHMHYIMNLLADVNIPILSVVVPYHH